MNGAALDSLKVRQTADALAPRFADALRDIAENGRGLLPPFGYLVESILADEGLIEAPRGPATPFGKRVAAELAQRQTAVAGAAP
jgi:hypothetical protein